MSSAFSFSWCASLVALCLAKPYFWWDKKVFWELFLVCSQGCCQVFQITCCLVLCLVFSGSWVTERKSLPWAYCWWKTKIQGKLFSSSFFPKQCCVPVSTSWSCTQSSHSNHLLECCYLSNFLLILLTWLWFSWSTWLLLLLSGGDGLWSPPIETYSFLPKGKLKDQDLIQSLCVCLSFPTIKWSQKNFKNL